jgi:hypothetical protein
LTTFSRWAGYPCGQSSSGELPRNLIAAIGKIDMFVSNELYADGNNSGQGFLWRYLAGPSLHFAHGSPKRIGERLINPYRRESYHAPRDQLKAVLRRVRRTISPSLISTRLQLTRSASDHALLQKRLSVLFTLHEDTRMYRAIDEIRTRGEMHGENVPDRNYFPQYRPELFRKISFRN